MQNLMKTKTCFEPFKYFILTRIHLRMINIILTYNNNNNFDRESNKHEYY